MTEFFVGTHMPNWLWLNPPFPHKLFVSHRRLQRQRTYKRATVDWALDSGGFTELNLFGRWVETADNYVRCVRRYVVEIGRLLWAAPQDWMCEPFVLAKTGLTVQQHQRRTVSNFLLLRELAPDLPFIPVLQGWSASDYIEHLELYERAGIDLRAEPVVGMGTFCRRASARSLVRLVNHLHRSGIRMHGFGLKTDGLALYGSKLVSSDSLAWSAGARRGRSCGREHKAATCSNCRHYAADWGTRVKAGIR